MALRRTIQLDAETIDAIVNTTVERVIEQMPKPEPSHNGTGALAVLLSAGTHARIDGKITMGDVVVSGGIVGAFAFSGAAIAATGGGDYFIRDFTRAGAFISLARLTVDAFNIWAMWNETFGQFLDYLERRAEKPPQERIREPILINAAKAEEQLEANGPAYWPLPNGQEVEIGLLSDYLWSALKQGMWSREHWCNKPDQNPPGVDRMKTRQWAGIKQWLIELNQITRYGELGREGLWRAEDTAENRAKFALLIRDVEDDIDTHSPTRI